MISPVMVKLVIKEKISLSNNQKGLMDRDASNDCNQSQCKYQLIILQSNF